MINRDLLSAPMYGEGPFQATLIEHTKLDLELVDMITGKPLGKAWLTNILEPLGIGCLFVESLTSYTSRLAEAHSVLPV